MSRIPDTARPSCTKCTRPAVRGKRLCAHHRESSRRARERRAERDAIEQTFAESAAKARDPKRNALVRKGQAAALYIRTSTMDQHPENQVPELKQLASANGLVVVDVYEEQASAVRDRPAFQRMMGDAHRGVFNVIIVWALDRLGRSMIGVVDTVQRLDHCGCRLLSVREQWLDTKGPVRQLLTALFGWVAEQERTRIIERTQAGLARARANGKRFGRPPVKVRLEEIAALVAEGISNRQIAKRIGCSRATVGRRLLNGTKPPPPLEPTKCP